VSVPLFDRATILRYLEELNLELAGEGDRHVELLVGGSSSPSTVCAAVPGTSTLGCTSATSPDEPSPSSPNGTNSPSTGSTTQRPRSSCRLRRRRVLGGRAALAPDDPSPTRRRRVRHEAQRQTAHDVVTRYTTACPHEADDPYLEAYVAEQIIAWAVSTGAEGNPET